MGVKPANQLIGLNVGPMSELEKVSRLQFAVEIVWNPAELHSKYYVRKGSANSLGAVTALKANRLFFITNQVIEDIRKRKRTRTDKITSQEGVL